MGGSPLGGLCLGGLCPDPVNLSGFLTEPLLFTLELLSPQPFSLPLQFPDVLNSKMPSGVAIVTKADLAI